MHLTRGDVQQVARFSEKSNEHKILTIYRGNNSRQPILQLFQLCILLHLKLKQM